MKGIQPGNLRGWSFGIAIALVSSLAIQATESIQLPAASASSVLAQGRSAPMQLARRGGSLQSVRRNLQGRAAGGRVRTGSSRSTENKAAPSLCPKATPPLTALVQFEEEARPGQRPKTNVWGYTTAAHPTLWFYMPYTQKQAIPANLTVVEDDGKSFAIVIPSIPVQLPNKPGIMAVRIPSSAKALDIGKRYRWALTLNCASSPNASDKMQVEGVIVRDNLDTAITATGIQKAVIYAENGIWHDALTTVAELRQKDFADPSLKSDWQSLLNSMVLSGSSEEFKPEEIVDQPFAN
ncbi:DUF928 domain-containing protein [Leptolyngbyaceae cyanobacterium UHCC 1019]